MSPYPDPGRSGAEAEDEGEQVGAEPDRVGERSVERLLETVTEETPADAAPLVDRMSRRSTASAVYGGRLPNAEIESLADHAVAEPIEIADATNVSDRRAEGWLGRTRALVRSLAGEDTAGGDEE